MNERNALSGKTVRWTFSDGPMAGKSFEHRFGEDGIVTWKMLDGEKEGMTGTSAKEKAYAATKIADDVIVASYISSSGYTLTTVLNTETNELAGIASGTNAKGEKEWFAMKGTFEIVA